jgi:type VI secretion system secreted protein Hcp
MIGDNFMWDPSTDKKAFVGETNDLYFTRLGAFEVSSFSFGMAPAGSPVPEGESDDDSEANSKQGSSKINTGLMGGVKLGGSILKKAGGGRAGGVVGGTGGGQTGAKGKPSFGTLTINKFVDNATTGLYEYCSKGDIIPTINLAIRKSGGDGLLYLQYVFRFNQVVGISWDGGAGDSTPKETFTLEFKAMGLQYISQSARGIAVSEAPKEWRWSVETEEGNNTLSINGEPPEDPVFLPGNVE